MSRLTVTLRKETSTDFIELPFVYPDLKIENPMDLQEFKTVSNGTLQLKGKSGVKRLTIESFLPETYEHWVNRTAHTRDTVINFMNEVIQESETLRLVITYGNFDWANFPCVVENWTYGTPEQNGDVKYTLSLAEQKEIALL